MHYDHYDPLHAKHELCHCATQVALCRANKYQIMYLGWPLILSLPTLVQYRQDVSFADSLLGGLVQEQNSKLVRAFLLW